MSRELDKQVAETVMQHELGQHDWEWDNDGHVGECRNCAEMVMPGTRYAEPNTNCRSYYNYSTNIADAWRVVEKMRQLQPGWRFALLGGDYSFNGWKAEWFGHIDPEENYGQRHGQAYADTAPEAICCAALEAVKE